MSETPRQAALLARLFAADADVREGALAGLIADPVAAASAGLGPHVRGRLDHHDPAVRLSAAEYLWRVSGDPAPAAAELSDRFQRRDVTDINAGMPLLRSLGRHAVGPLTTLVRDGGGSHNVYPDEFHRWAARTALTAGPDGLILWEEMMREAVPATTNALLIELAELGPKLECDHDRLVASARTGRDFEESALAVGAALWRLTWRVDREWLARIDPDDEVLAVNPALLGLVTRVVVEHLGRRPDLAPLARALLVRYAAKDAGAATAEVRRLAVLGACGWGVILLVLQDSPPADRVFVPPDLRAAALREAVGRPACLGLVQHHAHRAVAARLADRESGSVELVKAAAEVVADIGPAAGGALPELLALIVREPHLGEPLAAAAGAVAAGYPLAAAAVVRALNALPDVSSRQAFVALARVLHRLDPDAGPSLVGDTSVADHVVSRLLDLGYWQDAAAGVRLRHAKSLADLLASPRAEVRARAAAALKHYLPELPGVWPAAVAALASNDETPAALLLPYFRALAPVADAVAVAAELDELFAEPRPEFAARAGVALWRLRRWDRVAPRLRHAVRTEPPDGRGWAVVRGMADRARSAHGLLEDLGELFADAPEAARAAARGLLDLPEPSIDKSLSQWLGLDRLPREIDWSKLRDAAEGESRELAPAFVFAVMAGLGCEGWSILKIWMIKDYRLRMSSGLAEAKNAIERAVEPLAWRPSRESRRAAVREFLPSGGDLPVAVCAMLEHPSAWFRWAGLELADAWGLPPREFELWVEDRRRDASPLVRERAARVTAG